MISHPLADGALVEHPVSHGGITVNAVAPGFIETGMTGDVSSRSRHRMLPCAAIRWAGWVEDVASAVLYVISDADYVTGHALVVDGGLILWNPLQPSRRSIER